jgi:outer membrane protein assembly factor BamB
MLKLATEKLHLEYETRADADQIGVTVHLTGHNGTEWQRILSTPTLTTPTLLLPQSGQRLLVAYSFDLYALDAHTGDILWQRDFVEPIWASYLVADEGLLVHLELSIACLNIDGSDRWRYTHNEIITQVTLQGDHLLVQDFDEQQFLLNLTTGVPVSQTG